MIVVAAERRRIGEREVEALEEREAAAARAAIAAACAEECRWSPCDGLLRGFGVHEAGLSLKFAG